MLRNFFIRQSFWDFLVGLGRGWFKNNFSIWKFFKSSRSILSKWTFRAKKVTRIFLLEIGELMELGFAGKKTTLIFLFMGRGELVVVGCAWARSAQEWWMALVGLLRRLKLFSKMAAIFIKNRHGGKTNGSILMIELSNGRVWGGEFFGHLEYVVFQHGRPLNTKNVVKRERMVRFTRCNTQTALQGERMVSTPWSW